MAGAAEAAEAKARQDERFPGDENPRIITYAQALKEVKDLNFCLSTKYGEQQMRADRVGAHLEILEFERVFVMRMRKLGVPLFAHCVMRGKAEQDRVKKAGLSKASWGNSPHNHGCAVDIIHGIRGWQLFDKHWEVIGHLGKETAASIGVKVEWGGDWLVPKGKKVGWDPAHWELQNWRSRKDEIA